MTDRLPLCCVLNPLDKSVSYITRCPAGTISQADEVQRVRFELTNRLVEGLGRLGRFWGEELERKRRRIPPHNVDDVHDSAPTFVPAATFGQHRSNSRHNCKYARWKS